MLRAYQTVLAALFLTAGCERVTAAQIDYSFIGAYNLPDGLPKTVEGGFSFTPNSPILSDVHVNDKYNLYTSEPINAGNTFGSDVGLYSYYRKNTIAIDKINGSDLLTGKVFEYSSSGNGDIKAYSPGSVFQYGDSFRPFLLLPGKFQDPFAQVVFNSVKTETVGTETIATFTPNFGLSVNDAAALGGYTGFNWVQRILHLPLPSPYRANSDPTLPISTYSSPFNDPVEGGYTYEDVDSYPFYLTGYELYNLKTNNTLSFNDTPADPCLFGGSGFGCHGKTALPGEYISFVTDLVGVLPDGKPGPSLFEFMWYSNFNGTVGGAARLDANQFADPDSGYGGTHITGENYPLGDGTTDAPSSPTNMSTVPIPSSFALLGVTLLIIGALSIYRSRRRRVKRELS